VRFVQRYDKFFAAFFTLCGGVQDHVSRPVLYDLLLAMRAFDQVFNKTKMDNIGFRHEFVPAAKSGNDRGAIILIADKGRGHKSQTGLA
jgi:hypothetical protein